MKCRFGGRDWVLEIPYGFGVVFWESKDAVVVDRGESFVEVSKIEGLKLLTGIGVGGRRTT